METKKEDIPELLYKLIVFPHLVLFKKPKTNKQNKNRKRESLKKGSSND